jgi:Fur family peroxide stress response transcriptional regulator
MGIYRTTAGRRDAGEVAGWCERFAKRCQARGVRVTAQRLAVYRALAEDRGHPTAEAVFARVRRHMPTLSLATVYRILDALERESLVRRVSSTGGVARFDANVEPHQHLVCRVCGRMLDLFAPEFAAMQLPVTSVPDFEVEQLDIRLVGRCAACRPKAVRRPTV